MIVRALLCATLVAGGSIAQQTSSWSRYRGPGGQGVALDANLPPAFTDADVRWRVPGGVGHSSPVVFGERLFLTRMAAEEGSREIVCFDIADGREVWKTAEPFEALPHHGLNNPASSTLVVDDRGVYVAWVTGTAVQALALDHEGAVRWRRELGAFEALHGGGNSAVLFEDLLVVQNEHRGEGSFVMALDAATGDPRWRLPRVSVPDLTSYAPPVPFVAGDGTEWLLLASTGHGLTAVDPRTGTVAWELDLRLENRVVGEPAISGDLVMVAAGVSGGGKQCTVVRVSGADTAPEIAYSPRRNLPYVPGPIAVGGRFFMIADNGIATCLDAATGDTVWRERLEGSFFSSPVSDGRVVWIANREGSLLSFAAADEFELLGSLDLGAPVFATPAIANDAMFVRTFEELICLGVATDQVRSDARR